MRPVYASLCLPTLVPQLVQLSSESRVSCFSLTSLLTSLLLASYLQQMAFRGQCFQGKTNTKLPKLSCPDLLQQSPHGYPLPMLLAPPPPPRLTLFLNSYLDGFSLWPPH